MSNGLSALRGACCRSKILALILRDLPRSQKGTLLSSTTNKSTSRPNVGVDPITSRHLVAMSTCNENANRISSAVRQKETYLANLYFERSTFGLELVWLCA